MKIVLSRWRWPVKKLFEHERAIPKDEGLRDLQVREPQSGRDASFLFSIACTIGALRKEYSLDFLFLLYQDKRKNYGTGSVRLGICTK